VRTAGGGPTCKGKTKIALWAGFTQGRPNLGWQGPRGKGNVFLESFKFKFCNIPFKLFLNTLLHIIFILHLLISFHFKNMVYSLKFKLNRV
jgi:hypothetical protein